MRAPTREQPLERLVNAAIVRVGGPLNARPVGSAARSQPARSLADIAHDVAAARAGGATLVVFAGEPTVRPDLDALLALGARAGARVGIVTSGRALLYPNVRARLVRGRVQYARLALYGHDAAAHDALTGIEGSFEQSTEGAVTLMAEARGDLFVDVACTVTRANEDRLMDVVETWSRWAGSSSVGLRFVAPVAGLDEGEWPSRMAASHVARALDRALEIAPRDRVAWEGFPPCMLARHADLRDETLRWGAPAFGPEDAGGALVQRRADAYVKPFPCQDCVNESSCPGVERAAFDRWGEKALAPTRSVRANSFNFEFVRRMGAIEPATRACPVRAAQAVLDPMRDLFLLGPDGASLYHSPTRDFTDEEIRRTKNDLEQIYLDVSDTAVLTEFTSGVRRARPHATCVECPERAACLRCWVEDPEPPFTQEERWLRSEVGSARGRVLDVGCGEQPYRAEIAEGIASGRMDYLGIDPDKAAIERFREAVPGGRLAVSGIEEFVAAPASFDCVLVVRSLNHFRDLEQSFAVIERVLRPGGVLYVADSVVFGMLRRREQVRYADTHAAVGHEHFRNWSSEQLLSFLQRYRFRVGIHHPVSRGGSAQWMVQLFRTEDGVSPAAQERSSP